MLTTVGGLAVLAGYIVKAVVNPALGEALIAGGTAVGLANARQKGISSEDERRAR